MLRPPVNAGANAYSSLSLPDTRTGASTSTRSIRCRPRGSWVPLRPRSARNFCRSSGRSVSLRLPTCSVTDACGGNTNSQPACLHRPPPGCRNGDDLVAFALRQLRQIGNREHQHAPGGGDRQQHVVCAVDLHRRQRLALSGSVIITLPARLRATRSLKVQTKP